MKLLAASLLASSVLAEYDYYEGERGKKKKPKKQVKRDDCGCGLNPRNAPDAVPTCVDDSGRRRKVIDWTCAATGTKGPAKKAQIHEKALLASSIVVIEF